MLGIIILHDTKWTSGQNIPSCILTFYHVRFSKMPIWVFYFIANMEKKCVLLIWNIGSNGLRHTQYIPLGQGVLHTKVKSYLPYSIQYESLVAHLWQSCHSMDGFKPEIQQQMTIEFWLWSVEPKSKLVLQHITWTIAFSIS